GVHINLRLSYLQIPEEDPIQCIVIILPCVGKYYVKIFPALIDYRRQPDDLRAGANDDEKLQLPVVFKMYIRIICPYLTHSFSFSILFIPAHRRYPDALD